MSEMQLNETVERFNEGLKKAADRARELGKAQKNKDWAMIAANLDNLRKKGNTMIEGRAMTRSEVLTFLDDRQKTLKIN